MSETFVSSLPEPEESLPVQIVPSLENFKSAYYWLNAKPDTDIVLLKGERIITIGDVRFINEQILKKLENYKDYGSSTAVTIAIGKNRIKEYASWHEFDRENWNSINEITKSLSISWDFSIQLPRHQLPQRHTVKIRIGNYIPPKDMFQLIMSSDDVTEVMEARAEGVCKVDFINQIIANELLGIVSSWYEGLRKTPDTNGPVQKFLQRHQAILLYVLINVTPVILMGVYHWYFIFFTGKTKSSYDSSLSNIEAMLLGLLIVYTVGQIIGRRIGKWLDQAIDSYKQYSQFIITKGDENEHNALKGDNGKITKDIVTRVFWGIVTTFIGIAIRYLFNIK